jgi:hypothetical protein
VMSEGVAGVQELQNKKSESCPQADFLKRRKKG